MTSNLDQIEINPKQYIGNALQTQILWIPANQRDYAWERKHVTDLFDDIAGVMKKHDESEHFLGTIVVLRKDGKLMVVDGQQRLATSLMLIAAFRDLIEATDAEQANLLRNQYMVHQDPKTKLTVPRLHLNDSDDEFFYDRIVRSPDDQKRKDSESKKPSRLSHKLIAQAAREAADRAKKIAGTRKRDDQIERIFEWVDFVRERARIIWVTVPDENAAYLMFETMNDRGLELSSTDLIKNYLFSRSDDKLDHVRRHWLSMSATLESTQESEIVKNYVRHYWIGHYKSIRTPELFAALKDEVKSKQDIVEFSNDLSASSALYVALTNSMHPIWNKYPGAASYITVLGYLNVKQHRPMLLAALELFHQAEVTYLLKMLTCWTVRLLIVGKSGSGNLETLFGSNAQKISKKEIKTATQLYSAMQKEIPDDDVFQSAFVTARVSEERRARYYLRALERTENKEANPESAEQEDVRIINLEHLLPEDPDDSWKHVPEEERELNTQRLGNQFLLSSEENRNVGSKSFAAKKPILSKSTYKLTKMVHQFDDWREKQINERQTRLAELAVKAWPLKPARN